MSILTERKSLRAVFLSWVFFIVMVFVAWTYFLSDEELAVQRIALEEKKISQELMDARKMYESSIRLHAGEEFEAAIVSYDHMIRSFQDVDELEVKVLVAEAAYNRGLAYGELGRTETLIVAMDKLSAQLSKSEEVRLRVSAAKARIVVGDVLIEEGKFELAQAVYDSVIEQYDTAVSDETLQDAIAEAHFSLAIIFDERMQLDQAKEAYTNVIERYQHSAREGVRDIVALALNNRGYITLRHGKKLWAEVGDGMKTRSLWGEALSDALAATKISPKDPYVLATLGYAQFLLYSEGDAKKNLRKSLEIGGEDFFYTLMDDALNNTISRDMDYINLVKKLWLDVQMDLGESEV